jgi:hypothetical protein
MAITAPWNTMKPPENTRNTRPCGDEKGQVGEVHRHRRSCSWRFQGDFLMWTVKSVKSEVFYGDFSHVWWWFQWFWVLILVMDWNSDIEIVWNSLNWNMVWAMLWKIEQWVMFKSTLILGRDMWSLGNSAIRIIWKIWEDVFSYLNIGYITLLPLLLNSLHEKLWDKSCAWPKFSIADSIHFSLQICAWQISHRNPGRLCDLVVVSRGKMVLAIWRSFCHTFSSDQIHWDDGPCNEYPLRCTLGMNVCLRRGLRLAYVAQSHASLGDELVLTATVFFRQGLLVVWSFSPPTARYFSVWFLKLTFCIICPEWCRMCSLCFRHICLGN